MARPKPRNWRCLGLLCTGLWATAQASVQVSDAANGSLDVESRTTAAAIEAFSNAKDSLLKGSYSKAVKVARPYCGHILQVCKYIRSLLAWLFLGYWGI